MRSSWIRCADAEESRGFEMSQNVEQALFSLDAEKDAFGGQMDSVNLVGHGILPRLCHS